MQTKPSVSYTADPDTFDCELPECAARFSALCATYYEGCEPAGDEPYNMQHCQMPGCCEHYPRGKNGDDCARCGLRACELCQCGRGTEDAHAVLGDPAAISRLFEDADGWVCEECLKGAGFQLNRNG